MEEGLGSRTVVGHMSTKKYTRERQRGLLLNNFVPEIPGFGRYEQPLYSSAHSIGREDFRVIHGLVVIRNLND